MNDIHQDDPNNPAPNGAPPAAPEDDVSARVAALQQEFNIDVPAPAAPVVESRPFDNQPPAEDAALQPVSANSALQGADVIRDQDKIMLVLAYVFPFVPFFTVSDSDYVKWHAKQGMGLLITCFVGSIVLSFLPVIGCLAVPLFGVAICVACVKGIIEALKPARWEIPVVSSLTKKLFG